MGQTIPITWEEKNIKQISTFVSDGDWIESKNQSPEGIRLIQTGNVGNGVYKDKTENARYISEDTFVKLNCTEIFPGDCLVSRLPDPIGRACLVPDRNERMITAVDCSIIRFNKELIVPKYFVYYSISNLYHNKIMSLTTGATRQRISRKNLETITIPLPNIIEQQRIVDKLDILVDDIEKEKQVIQQKLQNAKELFESELHKLFTESTDGWIETKLDDVCVFERGLTYSKQDERDFSNNVVLRANNIDLVSHALNFDELKFIDDAINIPMEKKIATNTILMCISSGSKSHLGKVAFVDRDYGYAFGGFMGLIKPMSNILPKYLYYVLVGPDFKDLIAHLTDGANINNLKYSNIQQFSFLLPTMEEQQRIVEKLDALHEQTQELEQIYTQQIADLDELKQAILKKAFNGEL